MLHEGGGGATTGLRECRYTDPPGLRGGGVAATGLRGCRYTDPPGSRGGGVAATGRGLTLLAHEISLLHPCPPAHGWSAS